jgi:DNA gyrase inhibitor GyrI
MSELDVRIVKLEPMLVASFLGFGPSPEEQAWKQLFAWARPKGLTKNLEKHRLFGFNNPNPSPGSPNYGYEVWMVIDPEEAEDEEAVKIKIFDGGLYAVTKCVVPEEQFEVIGETWKKLATWQEDSRYKCGKHQWLEETLPDNPPGTEFVLDLYIPLAE